MSRNIKKDVSNLKRDMRILKRNGVSMANYKQVGLKLFDILDDSFDVLENLIDRIDEKNGEQEDK